MIPTFTNFNSDTPVGSIISYAGIISTPVSSPSDTQQSYTTAKSETGITNNIERYGWMVCDGRLLYCRDYPELFQALGFLYSLEGEPTEVNDNLPANQQFRIPDYRGYFLRGSSGSSGNDPDFDERTLVNKKEPTATNLNKIGSVQEDTLQEHQHQYSKASKPTSPVQPGSTTVPLAVDTPDLTGVPTSEIDANPINGNVRVSSETRPKNMYVNYLIKYAYVR